MDGLNLVMAGIYLSTRGTINAENLNSVEYYGTQRDDEVTINASVTDHVHVDTGKGNDRADVNVTKQANVNIGVTFSDTFKDAFNAIKSIINAESIEGALKDIVNRIYDELTEGIQNAIDNPQTIQVEVLLGEGNDAANVHIIDGTDMRMPTLMFDSVTGAFTGFDIPLPNLTVTPGVGDIA